MSVTAESLFVDYFLPLYPKEAARDLALARATDANPARNRAIFAQLTDAARVFVEAARDLFGADLGLDFTPASVHRLGAAITRARRDGWMSSGGKGSPDSQLFNVVVHGAAYVGECVVRAGGAWSARNPLWESVVRLESRIGEGDLAIFHWWLKSLDDEAFDAAGAPRLGLAERFRTHVEVAQGPGDLPVIADPARTFPRLSKGVRYDVFYKYLKAHLPEIRDVGHDFPTPERFAAYALSWLEFKLVGGGRMLLMYGAGAGGLHAFWLTKEGFQKSALFASEAEPAPSIEIEGDVLRVQVTQGGERTTREVMWWGP